METLSASKIKTLEGCTWIYWANYHLKLPQTQNDGARMGSICHSIFEFLIKEKRKKYFDIIIKHNSVDSIPSIKRLIDTYIRKSGLIYSEEVKKKIYDMILVGLKSDFYVKGCELIEPELAFDIVNENPKYHLKGFIDKPFKNKQEVIIDDYKSSKKQFEGSEKESNTQALLYSLASKKLWPELKPRVRFIFLQFPENPIMELEFSEDTLSGFEAYLSKIQKQVNNFDVIDAYTHFAADHTPPKGEFKGRLMCGFAKSPGQKKKDGTNMWVCSFKFPFIYYSVIKENGEIAYSSFDKNKIKLKSGETIKELFYEGCPRFRNVINNSKIQKAVVYNKKEDIDF